MLPDLPTSTFDTSEYFGENNGKEIHEIPGGNDWGSSSWWDNDR